MYAPLILEKLSQISKTNDKIALVREQQNNEEFLELLDAALNPYKVYGYKVVFFTKSTKIIQTNLHKEFMNLLQYLQANSTNNDQRQLVTDFLNKCDIHSQQIYADIICKNLRIGVQASLVNKALQTNFIPDFKCMLASPMDESVTFNYPVIVQNKYDGVRCLIVKDGNEIKAFTREGKALLLPQIFNNLLQFKESFVLDGELLFAGNRLKTAGVVNKVLKGTAKPIDTDALIFVAFDILTLQDFFTTSCNTPLRARLVALETLFTRATKSMPVVVLSQTSYAESYEDVVQLYKIAREHGEEGIIVKNRNGFYDFKRSSNWIKFKAVQSCTLRLIGVTDGTGKFEGKVGALVCESACGKLKVNVGSGLTDEDRDTIKAPTNREVFVEVIFNELQKDLDDNYYLFLPRFKEFRLDKTEADTLDKILNESEEWF